MRIAFDRPEVRNAFRPHTVDELYRALDHARMTPDVGVRAAHRQRPERHGTAAGRSAPAATSGSAAAAATSTPRARPPTRSTQARVKAAGGRLHILEVQRLIRTMPKVVVAVVNGWAAGGGHSPARRLRPDHRQPRARPVQADRRRRRARSTAGYGSAYLAKMVGQKFAREIFFLGRTYSAEDMQPDGRGQHRRRPRRPRERRRCEVAARDQRQEPDRAADAEVRVQPRPTTG